MELVVGCVRYRIDGFSNFPLLLNLSLAFSSPALSIHSCNPWGSELRPKKLRANVAVSPVLFRFLANGPLSRVSRQSRLSVNDKGNNEMIPKSVHRSPDIYLMVEENPGKSQLGDRPMKAVRSVLASDRIHYLHIINLFHFSPGYVMVRQICFAVTNFLN